MTTAHEKPSSKDIRFAVIATDVVICTIMDGKLKVLLIPINSAHFKNSHAFPGGMILPHETADDSVKRHMKAKAGVGSPSYMEQLYSFSAVDRDPRGRVVSIAYLALISAQDAQKVKRDVLWADIRKLPALAYDHNTIAKVALERLGNKIKYTTIGRHLLPDLFTLTELQETHEIVLGQALDKRNFRKKVLALDFLKPAGKMKTGGRSRPAELYRFAKGKDLILGGI